MTAPDSTATAIGETAAVKPRAKDVWVPGVLSVLVPGAGQFIYGNSKRGTVFLLFFVAMLALYWPVRIPRSFVGLAFLLLGVPALILGATLDGFYAKRPKCRRASAWWLFLALPLVAAGWWAHSNLWLRAAGFRSFEFPSRSMERTISEGDYLIVDLDYYKRKPPSIGDIIVFRKGDVFFAKRVIATGGSTIIGRNGEVFVDGRKLTEPYVLREGASVYELDNFGPFTVPQNKLFVLGDNRDVSLDSRMPDYGPIDLKDVRGRALYVYRTRDHQLGGDLR